MRKWGTFEYKYTFLKVGYIGVIGVIGVIEVIEVIGINWVIQVDKVIEGK